MKIKSKYCIQHIFSFLKKEVQLNIIKYNKKYQKIFDISKYDYILLFIEKNYLNIYNESILYLYLGQNLKDNEICKNCNYLIKILKHEYSKSYSFNFKNNNINNLLITTPINLTPNLFDKIEHLVITKLSSIRIPIGILMNLNSLCLKKINNIIFEGFDKAKNITLDKLENLELSSIYVKSNVKIKFIFPNLKKLKLKNKDVYSFSFLDRNFGFTFAYNFFKKNYLNFEENKNYKNEIQKDIFDCQSFPKKLESFYIKSKN